MQNKPAKTLVKIHDIIEMRWSPRAFDPQKTVSDNDLMALMEAARWAPSCFNDQPWRYIICVKAKNESSWQKAFSTIVEKNQQWAKNAPVLIITVSMENFAHNGKPNRWSMYDTGAASANLCLQATALGLIVHQMGGFDSAKVVDIFNLPDDCTPMSMMAVGYQADIDKLDEEFKQAELAERLRAPLEQRFYFDEWNNSPRN